jgi:glycosyltransferase involved in cell wall biosynthesis
MKTRLVSILVPVYNERHYLRRTIKRVLAAPLPDGFRREIIIVDDGSTDGSSQLVDAIAREHPMVVRSFHQERNLGKGAAIRRAIQEMRGELAIFQDADLEYDPNDYPRLLEPLITGYADAVYGSRFASTTCRRVLNYHHALGNSLITVLSNVSTGFNLTDIETGYKAFRADVLRTIPIRSERFGIEPELTAKIAKRHCVVYEVPISYHGRSYAEGKKITWRDGLQALGTIAKYALVDDCWEERYGHYVLDSLLNARRLTEWSVKTIEPYLGQRIIEIGSGTANISRQIPRREHLTVSDCDETYLRLLRLAFHDQDTVAVRKLDLNRAGDFTPLAHRYDTVLCLNVLEHIQDDRRALKRMASLLEPGGRLVLQVPQHQSLFGEMDRALGHHRRYDQQDLREKLTAAGFEVERLLNFNAIGILGWYLNARLLGRTEMSKVQLKLFDSLVPILRRIEARLSLPGLGLIAVARVPR